MSTSRDNSHTTRAQTAYLETDYLVLGSGIAGLNFALQAAPHGKVLVVAKKALDDTATNWAQGGVAAVLAETDSFDKHIEDTLTVGDGLCDRAIVEMVVREGPAQVRRLLELGVNLARGTDGELDLTREGGHSERRVVHYQDITGREIQRAMLAAAAAHPNITIIHDHIAVDLLSMAKYGGDAACFGAYILDSHSGEVKTVVAGATVLATGGAGKVFVYTSNPDVATGDGIAMAYRIGAVVSDLEFVQFHPTVLFHPHAKSFLISEALRGEGGILRHLPRTPGEVGATFMENYHPLKSLGPRDVVARAIDNELKKTGADAVGLDMTHLPADFVRERFPNIYERCLALGIDMTKQPIPVVPAAHYMCGGVKTDEFGQTSVRNLFAVGETASTGLHGACRLASNSLLEGMVFSTRAAAAAKLVTPVRPSNIAPWSSGDATDSQDAIVVSLNWDEIRRFMWSYVSIVRSDKRLERARRRIEVLREEIREYYWDFKITSDLVELRNLALVAHLIIESARRRKESRGLHYSLDYPTKFSEPMHTELQLTNGPTA
ncbi:MAG: L-aspartate oxidase [Myxococcales bacterium]|nr:L-aspartate oxidase [Myxococcales bacterium]